MNTDRPTKLSTDSSKVYQWRRHANVAKLLIDEGIGYIFAHLKLRSYWAEVRQFLHNVARTWQMNL